jgi:osmotically-inducible protein OsmY
MKQQMINIGVVILFLGGMTFAVPSVRAQEDKTEQHLSSQIKDRFEADGTLKNHNLKARMNGTVATLTETVETKQQKDQAARLARVEGITSVENHIALGPAQKGVAQKTEEKAKEGVEKGASATGKGVQKAGEGLSKAGNEVTDASILSSVKARFSGEDLLKGSDINVDCDQKVVTLKGTVASRAGRDRAVQLAQSTKGVEKVIDRLVIAPK